MKAIIAGNTAIIKFKYADAPATQISRPRFPRRVTTAYLKNENNDVTESVDAINSEKVPFSFAQGRKAAFTKLLKKMNISRPERTTLWAEFFNQCPNTVKYVSMKSEAIKKKTVA